ncbi:MAG: NADH-quinone oxidoreductase subunit M, partial [Myxococcota bacterium]
MVTGVPWLTILWAVPMVGAAGVILLPSAARHLAKYAALVVSLVVLAIAVTLAVTFDPAGAQYQFVEDHAWIPSFGTGYILGLDGIALALVVLTAVLVPLLIVAGWHDGSDQARSTHTYMALT